MSIEEEIVAWASLRPIWQKRVIWMVAQGEEITQEDISTLVDQILEGKIETQPLLVKDFPSQTESGSSVHLLEIRDIKNVNALLQEQPLSFEKSGLVIVYGDNGSGKSGYARLIKQIVRARHNESILTDIFTDRGISKPTATVVIEVDGHKQEFQYPEGIPPEVAQITFFDKPCGDLYVSAESEVTYRPSALYVLDGLIKVCDLVRNELDKRITGNALTAPQLPVLPDGTKAKTFLSSLSADSTDIQIEMICDLPLNIDEKIAHLAREEDRLRTTDPAKEKERLQTMADNLSVLANQLKESEQMLGDRAIVKLIMLREDFDHKKAAADLASKKRFDAEPLMGVGSAVWLELWQAARKFAAHSCPTDPFPPTGSDARCPLCQQILNEEASDRMSRFEAFVLDVTQQELETSTKNLRDTWYKIDNFIIQPKKVIIAIEGLKETYRDIVNDYQEAFGQYETRKNSLSERILSQTYKELSLAPLTIPKSDALVVAEEVRRTADGIDGSIFEELIKRTKQDRLELEASRMLSGAREKIIAERERLKKKRSLDQVKESTNTQGISKKAADLTRSHVTAVIRDRFTREADRLKLDRITLEDIGGRKGSLQHQPAFVGAFQRAPLPRVLSEGEQTALGLAGFFTEVYFEQSKSSIIFDDPVSSLDHVRRGQVAKRISALAKDRQVIVFTHNIAFVADLQIAARHEGVKICGRSIEKRLSGRPGSCLMEHPWKLKDVPKRLQDLDQQLKKIKTDMVNWDRQIYEKETSDWAGKLSETWERMINLEIVGQLVDHGTQEVRPKMFKVLARITDEDDQEFQAGYTMCSRWARRHDKSIELDYVSPPIEELHDELNRAREWWERIRKYRN